MINKRKKAIIATWLLASCISSIVSAQDKVEASIGADLVSSYIWRGQDLGSISIQPSAGIAYKGFLLEAWGSVGFQAEDAKEIDLTLGYETGGFSISVTDYWTDKGENFKTGEELGASHYFHYGSGSTTHVFEAQVGYDFGVLAVNWYTNFAGNDGLKANGKRAYSSYLSVGAPFRLGGIDWRAEIGMVPWETSFYNEYTSGFCVSEITLGAAKDIPVTDAFSLPLFARLSVNPRTEGAYFTFGLSF